MTLIRMSNASSRYPGLRDTPPSDYVVASIAVAVLLLLMFAVLEHAKAVPKFESLSRWSVAVWISGTALLVADVALPVPSSAIMAALGSAYGWFWGFLLSWVGTTGAALVAYYLGRSGELWIQGGVSDARANRMQMWLTKWGALTVIATRPIPILSETAGVMAGASGMSFRTFSVSAVCGCFPTAVVYAGVGAIAPAWIGCVVLALTFAVALASMMLRHMNADTSTALNTTDVDNMSHNA